MRHLLAIATVSLLLLAGCGSQPVSTGGQISATLKDTGLTLGQTSVNAGTVTFKVKNSGTITHELVVIKTDVAADKIALNPDEAGKMSEEGTQGESGDLAVGEAKDFILDLAPGHYVLMCNLAGHYMAGMHIAFVVR